MKRILKNMENLISRPIYIDHIISSIDRGMMIFLIGQRRVGKSYILLLMKQWLEQNISDSNVLYIDKEATGDDELADAKSLYDYVAEHLHLGQRNYLLIDEVQNITEYEHALRRLYSERRCQIIATGSNADIFSTQLATRLAGRYIEIPIYSLTYQEFLTFHNLKDCDENLTLYIKVGGLPGLAMFGIEDERHIRDYIGSVYNTVMLKDVIERNKVRNIPYMNNLAAFIADNIGKIISVKNITNFMKSKQGKESMSDTSTSSYIKYLSDALILSPVYRYNIHGKELLEQNYKYYFADHGIRNYICHFNIRSSIEKILENIVWHHLLVQDFDVTVGQLRAGEIDFVATKDEKRIYIQVTYQLSSEETIEREFGNLAAIRDNYPKYVVSMDPIGGELAEYPGIQHLRLRDFLKLTL